MQIPCICPALPAGKTRHPNGDQVELRERLDFRSCIAIRNDVTFLKREDPESSLGTVLALLTEQYLLFGIESWTLADDDGPIAVTPAAIREHVLADVDIAMQLGDLADEQYSAVMLPLLMKASESSRPTPTDESTSPTSGSSPELPTPLKPSSTSTSPTDVTEPTSTSPDGASSSSPKSKSAA